MSVHPYEGDLHRHFDGELPARESWELEAHLRECRSCAAAYDEIREMAEMVAELPDAIEPPHDLWAGIAARIGNPENELANRRFRRERRIRMAVVMSWFGAVAAALVLGVGLGRIFPGNSPQTASGGGTGTAPVPAVTPTAMLASYEEPAYDQAVAELEAILAAMREDLEPETVQVVEENLAIIDQAIAEARAALLQDPANQQLHSHLSHTMKKKLDVLRMVTGAAI